IKSLEYRSLVDNVRRVFGVLNITKKIESIIRHF
ncbi:uncharacterized, partial [Tachysurus ichikawai]